MLYNKNWDAKTVTSDPFTLEGLIAWLEKQPAGDSYDYYCMGECLLGLWTKSIDPDSRAKDSPGNDEIYVYDALGAWRDLSVFGEIAQGTGMARDWTFGGALSRARKAVA